MASQDQIPTLYGIYNDKILEMQRQGIEIYRAASDYEWEHPMSAADVFIRISAFVAAMYVINQQINQKMNEIDFTEL